MRLFSLSNNEFELRMGMVIDVTFDGQLLTICFRGTYMGNTDLSSFNDVGDVHENLIMRYREWGNPHSSFVFGF